MYNGAREPMLLVSIGILIFLLASHFREVHFFSRVPYLRRLVSTVIPYPPSTIFAYFFFLLLSTPERLL